MSPQSEAGVVVGAGLIGLPDLNQRFRHRAAIPVEHQPGNDHSLAARPVGREVALQRRIRLEVWPFGLRDRRAGIIAARGRKLQSLAILSHGEPSAEQRQRRRAQEGGKCRSTIEQAESLLLETDQPGTPQI
jgi:hypothetical protein